jgi:hypothetical protein
MAVLTAAPSADGGSAAGPDFRRPIAPTLILPPERRREMSPIRGTRPPRPGYQTWVVELQQVTTCPTISGRSNTDWIAIRPGPCRASHTDLACHRAELNQ